MKPLRRLLGWSLFLGLLWAVGWAVFHFVRYRPRLTIPELALVHHLSSDGSRLVTCTPPGLNHVFERGPVQVWDTRGGRIVSEFVGDQPASFHFSPDGGAIAAGFEDGTLRLIDWRAGQERRIEGVNLGPLSSNLPWPRFSPGGRWLFVSLADQRESWIIDVAAGRVALHFKNKFVAFNSDERLAFVHTGSQLEVWDLKALKKVATLPVASDWISVSPDSRTLLTRRVLPPPRPIDDAPVAGVDVWDLASYQRRFHLDLWPAGYWRATYSPDGRTLALWSFSDLALLDATTGQLLGTYSKNMNNCGVGGFSADGSLWFLGFLADGPQSDGRVTMFDAATGQVLWEKPGRWFFEFIGADRILHQVRGKAPQLLDARSGELRAAMPKEFAATGGDPEPIRDVKQTSDGRHFVFAGRQIRTREPYFWEAWLAKRWPEVFGNNVSVLLVIESATGRELLRLVNAGHLRQLSDDASTLVTVDVLDEDHWVTCIWDVSPSKAYVWAIGAAAGTGIVLLGLRRAWRKLARRGPSSKQAPLAPTPA